MRRAHPVIEIAFRMLALVQDITNRSGIDQTGVAEQVVRLVPVIEISHIYVLQGAFTPICIIYLKYSITEHFPEQ